MLVKSGFFKFNSAKNNPQAAQYPLGSIFTFFNLLEPSRS